MPTGSVLQVSLENVRLLVVMLLLSMRNRVGGVMYTLESLFFMMVMYMFYASFSFCSQ